MSDTPMLSNRGNKVSHLNNEPKKETIEFALSKTFPEARAYKINQRKHTATVIFHGRHKKPDIVIEARTHHELWYKIDSIQQERIRRGELN